MLKKLLGASLLLTFLFSCRSNHQAYTKFLNRDFLPSQFIEIDNNKDTSVRTAHGAILQIQKGSFSSDHVRLRIKEAYSVEDMILAGLTTESDGKPLSSGGMIFLGTENKNVQLDKPIHISIPTDDYDHRMQLFRGEENDDKLNWVDPQPLADDDSLPAYLQMGKTLFERNCASCHGTVDKGISAPALSGLESRGPWYDRKNIAAFVRNPPGFMAISPYLQCQKARYGILMTPFPQLDDTAVNSICDYIENEDRKKGVGSSPDSKCEDSCRTFDSLYRIVFDLDAQRDKLINDNGERIKFERDFSPDTAAADVYIPDTIYPEIDKVEPVRYRSIYYEFNIKTLGWYNVDCLINTSGATTELKVETQGDYKINMSVFLIVPDQRVFTEGGPLTGETNIFGFYTRDGNIALPAGSGVIVFAVGEADGSISFDYKKFTSTDKQTIVLEPRIVSKKEFNRTVRRFRLDNASIEVKDSKNADAIRKTDRDISSKQVLLESYRLKNCSCCCQEKYAATAADSTAKK